MDLRELLKKIRIDNGLSFRFEWAIKLAYFFIDIVTKVRYNGS